MNGQSGTEGMRFGVRLTEQPDVDRMIRQARLADEQGYDSVWLNDHLMPPAPGAPPPGGLPPFDAWTTMTAIGALTRHVRLCWSMLNPFFRQPALLAKMVATLDQITHGRAVLSLGAGWFKLECDAYDLPFLDDHAARIAHEREIGAAPGYGGQVERALESALATVQRGDQRAVRPGSGHGTPNTRP